MAHTPGKWSVGFHDGSGAGEDGYFTIVSAGGAVVVRSGDSFGLGYGIEDADDATLIAAAPDLYEALQNLMNGIDTSLVRLDTDADETLANAMSKIRAALRKARGETGSAES